MPEKGPNDRPLAAVDVIIACGDRIVLIERRFPPHGWALPGGFVESGESVEQAARREAGEETSLELDDLRQFHVYSEPGRDPRRHVLSVVFTARGRGRPEAADDARGLMLADPRRLPEPMAFDHRRIIADYLASLAGKTDAPGGEMLYNTPKQETNP